MQIKSYQNGKEVTKYCIIRLPGQAMSLNSVNGKQ